MAAKWMLRWRPAAGFQAGPVDEEVLGRLLEAFDAKRDPREKRFEANIHLMRQTMPMQATDNVPVPGGMKDLWLVRVNDALETFYLLNRREHCVLEADSGILKIIESKIDYRTRSVIKLEGKRYSKGDFLIRLATATQTITGVTGQQLFLGHILEVEYSPVSNLALAGPLMQEFVSMLSDHIPRGTVQLQAEQPLGSLEVIQPAYDKFTSLPQTFGNMHCAVLYAEVAVAFMQTQR